MRLKDYFEAAPGRRIDLARTLGVPRQLLSQWTTTRPVPLDRCVAIERATDGAVTRRDLRPADWWQIWPELVTDAHPIPDTPTTTEAAA